VDVTAVGCDTPTLRRAEWVAGPTRRRPRAPLRGGACRVPVRRGVCGVAWRGPPRRPARAALEGVENFGDGSSEGLEGHNVDVHEPGAHPGPVEMT
jgi:hypothetical protein